MAIRATSFSLRPATVERLTHLCEKLNVNRTELVDLLLTSITEAQAAQIIKKSQDERQQLILAAREVGYERRRQATELMKTLGPEKVKELLDGKADK